MSLSASSKYHLSEITSTIFIPLYLRAMESQRPDALVKDAHSLTLIQKLELDPTKFDQAQVSEEVQVSILLRSRQFDQLTGDFLSRNSSAVVVYLGCGLDTRFERVDNGKVKWYDLDLPEVIDLRRELIGEESDRHHLLACSALDFSWMDLVSIHESRPFLFLAEGIFMFFEDHQVRDLVLALKDNFPNSELVFDAFSPFYVWANNRRVKRTKIGALTHWALSKGKELEGWGEGIHLISEWHPFLCPEPRLSHIRWVRFVPMLYKTMGIFHYRL